MVGENQDSDDSESNFNSNLVSEVCVCLIHYEFL